MYRVISKLGEAELPQGGIYGLMALVTIEVPELSFAVIPHDATLFTQGMRVLISRSEGVFIERNLLVDCGLVSDGEVSTSVFNLSTKPVKIKKGQIISQLLGL